MATAGSYRLGRALGERSRVHEARHDRLAGRFAVKLFGDVEPRAFQRGAQQASALRHPGIVKVVDYGAPPGNAFVVMEFLEGRSLADLVAAEGALAPDTVARIVDSVALGLQAAHRQGVAHGHLSPERIFLVTADGGGALDAEPGAAHTKILGFGLGPERPPGPRFTQATPYEAPERLVNEASPLADQYALAAIAYELLTGVPPAGDAAARRAPHSIREYDPTINVIVDDVVQRALTPDPGARWADVYTFAARLREVADAGGTFEEKTRLAPLPLTVSRHAETPTPIDLPPVIASIDVDLRTPQPRRLELPLPGEISMNPPRPRPPSQIVNGSSRRPTQIPGQMPPLGPPAARPPGPRLPTPTRYPIHPTPTFSFTDDPAPSPLYKPRRDRRGSGGGLALAVLVLAAGAGGYFAVQTHAWRRIDPLVERGKALVASLRSYVPGASLEPETPPQVAPAEPAPSPTVEAPATAPPAPAAGAVAAPVIHPDVVQLPPAPPSSPSHAKRPSHPVARAHHKQAPKDTFDEAAAEKSLLAPSSGR